MPLDEDVFGKTLGAILDGWGVSISPTQLDLLQAHFETVVDTNRTMNLTRITDPEAAAVKHYADALALIPWSRECGAAIQTILDIGSGAGFPAVPLAVMCPDSTVTALDATGKKARFLERMVEQLQLANLQVENAHAEHWHTGRRFDAVLLRGVGRLAKCLDQGVRHIAATGRIVTYKTASLAREELDEADARAAPLRLRADMPFQYQLELRGETLRRALHVYRRRVKSERR